MSLYRRQGSSDGVVRCDICGKLEYLSHHPDGPYSVVKAKGWAKRLNPHRDLCPVCKIKEAK